jgi:hypothetical protein
VFQNLTNWVQHYQIKINFVIEVGKEYILEMLIYYYSVQKLTAPRILSKMLNIRIYKTTVLSVVFTGANVVC